MISLGFMHMRTPAPPPLAACICTHLHHLVFMHAYTHTLFAACICIQVHTTDPWLHAYACCMAGWVHAACLHDARLAEHAFRYKLHTLGCMHMHTGTHYKPLDACICIQVHTTHPWLDAYAYRYTLYTLGCMHMHTGTHYTPMAACICIRVHTTHSWLHALAHTCTPLALHMHTPTHMWLHAYAHPYTCTPLAACITTHQHPIG